ncbi:hypothetical protein LTS07_007586 [Exophiala sideris]|nr:hypothetical protein LTS07_007586 [Exophiala sideris]KAK5186634.1 hypothetical protein LTR44_000640 [Eurotiomycetes sp. CCFEE 6388]
MVDKRFKYHPSPTCLHERHLIYIQRYLDVMKLTTSTVALILALVSVQVGAIPAPQTSHVGHPHEESHTFHRGGLSGGRPRHGPMSDEEEPHLVRRIDYVEHPSANWKWWQKQGTNKMIGGGNPNVRMIDVKNDPIGERLDWKRDESAVKDQESHLERRIDYVEHPSANWKWWQKQGTNKMIGGGNPNVRMIDVKNDPIGERLDWKRNVVTELENEAHLRGKGSAQDKWISVPVSKEN